MAFWNFYSSLFGSVRRDLEATTDQGYPITHQTYEMLGLDTTGPPPPYEDHLDEPPRKIWQIKFDFKSDPQEFKKRGRLRPLIDWYAELELETWDLTGLMRDGLFLRPDNVLEEEGHVQSDYHPEDRCSSYTRSYTIVDPRWSGHLYVTSWDMRPLASFRVGHLSASKVGVARVEDEEENTVYCYNVDEPERSANFIYDDMPMGGLWPWPKEEYVAEGQSEENS